jgi:hypothetical protein
MEKLAFTFWDGPQLSLLNIISILSFARLNLDTTLIIYTVGKGVDINASWKSGQHSKTITRIYSLDELASEPNILIKVVESELTEKISSVVQIADYVRIQKLYEHGGIWIDTDVLFYKKIPDSLWAITYQNGFVISYLNTITTGFLGFPKLSEGVGLALNKANKKISENNFQNNYQSFGPLLWEEVFLEYPEAFSEVRFLSEKLVYPVLWNRLEKFFFQAEESINLDETIGVHWYGGSNFSRSFINCNLTFLLKLKTPLTNFQKIIANLDQQVQLLGRIKQLEESNCLYPN